VNPISNSAMQKLQLEKCGYKLVTDSEGLQEYIEWENFVHSYVRCRQDTTGPRARVILFYRPHLHGPSLAIIAPACLTVRNNKQIL
jgi:hypothetical protein